MSKRRLNIHKMRLDEAQTVSEGFLRTGDEVVSTIYNFLAVRGCVFIGKNWSQYMH